MSGAKFNITKTVIIPVGSLEYRSNVLTTRKIDNTGEDEILEEITITKDGTPVRVLGAYIGNKLDQVKIWTLILEKIEKKLEQWSRSHPMQDG